jgi:hypothetical protein
MKFDGFLDQPLDLVTRIADLDHSAHMIAPADGKKRQRLKE